MTIWKHFSDPHKNQKISVNITDGEVNVVINDGGGSHYAQRITPPETYATKKKQEEIKKHILSMEGMSK
mgnify:CR=1 FL=1|jgi:hypothetical protein